MPTGAAIGVVGIGIDTGATALDLSRGANTHASRTNLIGAACMATGAAVTTINVGIDAGAVAEGEAARTLTASTDADGAAGTGMATSTTIASGAEICAGAVAAAPATTLAIGVTADAVGFAFGEGGADAA